ERAVYLGQAFLSGAAADAFAAWSERLLEAHLICPHWPAEVGGRGLSGVHLAILNEEFANARVPRVTRGMGESLVGPSIIVHGTDEQKAYFLPRIISGQDRYCQGFSEPDHGSDLAGVETRGVVDGNEVVISGQKVWTSGAHLANMIFILCRTDPDAPKHRGLSYVLAPMADNGIELQPLRQPTGASGFSHELIEGCRAPLFNVIGGLNNGWRVAMTTLGNERGGGATTQHLRYEREFWDLVDDARKRGRTSESLVRQDLAWAFTHVELMRFQGIRLLSTLAARREPGPEASVSKLFWSEYHKRFGEIALSVTGSEGMAHLPAEGTGAEDGYRLTRWQSTFVQSRAGTIFSGTSQIQRNIIGERALGLPKEPSAERS
ncbi:MAG TPA: acyl-CoA dehydrogenase family protein, partial [Acidimicrobiales bacterium]|nr:acyl-CoA dehydrogenase family protein [Acidimicrobiales bacterium]